MVKIYASLDPEGFINGWGKAEYGAITVNPKESILLNLEDNHPVLTGGVGEWSYLNGELFKDDSRLIDNLKNDKKAELSQACQESILGGFTSKVNGVEYHFSYDREAQINFQETYHLFQNSVVDSVKWSAHLKGKPIRIDLNKKDFEVVFFASVRHKQENISKFKDQIEPLIDAQSTIEGLKAINWEGLVINPDIPAVVFKTEDTLDKQVDTLDALTKSLNQKTELSDMAIMEIAMMTSMMTGGTA